MADGGRSGKWEVSLPRVTTVTTVILALHVGASPLVAQDPGETTRPVTDPVRAERNETTGATCYRHARWIVVERPLTESVGSDLFIRPHSTDRCDADSLPGDLVLRNEWAEYFGGLRGDVLLIDSGTGPDIRGLILVDLRGRRRIATLSYVDLEPGPDSATLGVWSGYELERPAPGCRPPVGGLGPGIDSLFVVDLATGAVRFGGRTRCAQRQ
jgi:hypothetical protein